MPPPDGAQHDGYIANYLRTGQKHIIGIGREVIGKRKNDTTFPMDLSISEMLNGTTRIFLGTVRDISVRKQAELRQATEHAVTRELADAATIDIAFPRILQSICENLSLKVGAVWLIDPKENVLRLKEIWHDPSANVSKFVTDSHTITFAQTIGLPGRVWTTGELHWIEDVTQDPNFLRAATASQSGLRGAIGIPLHSTGLVTGVIEYFSDRIQQCDPQLMAMFASIGSQIGQFMNRKHAEEESRQLGRQLCHAQKMEALGTLAGGIAHDFNNILTSINGFTELALMKDAANQKDNHHLQQVLQAGRRAKDLTQQILAFSCHSEHERKPIQFSTLVQEVIKLIRATLPTTIDIRCHPLTKDDTILGNPTELHQVLMNLCTNAAHAMHDQVGVLEISLEPITLSKTFLSTHPDLPACPYLRLTVTDTGRGMTPEVQERIFEPFFTTKDAGVGTGLGLSVVHGIIKSHQGAITVQSHLGEGTTFEVYLPRINAKTIKETRDESIPFGKEHILFIDDEKTLTHLAGEMLSHLGYQVTVRTGSIEGLEVFRSAPERFDLVITDKTMPNMTGEQLAKAVLQIRPDIPIILSIGFSDSMTPEYAKMCGIRACLMKPFSLPDLAQTIRQVLDPPAHAERKDLEPATRAAHRDQQATTQVHRLKVKGVQEPIMLIIWTGGTYDVCLQPQYLCSLLNRRTKEKQWLRF